MSRCFPACAYLLAALACGEPGSAPLPDLQSSMFDCRAAPLVARNTDVPLSCPLDADCDARLVTGHRGAGGDLALFAPENSLSAIRLAILLGADIVEIDVRDTSDGQLVLMHDSSLERTTGVALNVGDMTLDEVTAVPLLADQFPGNFSCERVPTFAEAAELARGRVSFDVDLKTSRADLVAEAIRDLGLLDQAFVSTPNPAEAALARATVPDVLLQARPDSLSSYEQSWVSLAPEIIEVDENDIEDFAAAGELSGKLFVDVFLQDAIALFEADTTVYTDIYDRGVDIVQSEFPYWVLDALGRGRWSSMPEHRDINTEIPLLDGGE